MRWRALGVILACAAGASCSASSETSTQFGFAPGSYESAAEDGGDAMLLSALTSDDGPVLPSPRPQAATMEDEPQAPADRPAEEPGGTADEQPAETVATASDLPSAAPQVSEAAEAAPAETSNTDSASRKRSFLSAFFSPTENRPAATAEQPAENPGRTGTAKADETADVPPAETDVAASSEPAATPQKNQRVSEAAESTPATASGSGPAPKKRSLLSAFFSPTEKKPAANPKQPAETSEPSETAEADAESQKPIIALASDVEARPIRASLSTDVLPGVRGREQLFEIVRKSDIGDYSDLDLYEGDGSYQVASAAGLARLAPNGFLKQRESVDISCFKPRLVRALKIIEHHFGKPVLITSGYRNPKHNRRVRGAPKSMHLSCAAADIQVEGVSKWELARFARSLPGRGGVGTYCHTVSVHVDVGPERDWNWRC